MWQPFEGCQDLFGRELEGHVNKGLGVEEQLGCLDRVEKFTLAVDWMGAGRVLGWNKRLRGFKGWDWGVGLKRQTRDLLGGKEKTKFETIPFLSHEYLPTNSHQLFEEKFQ